MDLEQILKHLQAQNAQFQETLLNIAKGQKELMVLISKKKKTRKPAGILNTGRRFKGPIRRALDFEVSSNEDDNQEENDKSVKVEENNNLSADQDSNEEKYSAEHYPPVGEKY